MTKAVRRWAVVVVLAAAGVGVAPAPRAATAQDAAPAAQGVHPNQQIATVEQLKGAAFSALKQGDFPQSLERLQRAADMTEDPSVRQMTTWLEQFEKQRQEFAAERKKQFDKAVADVKKLIENGHESYALDAAARASLLAEDKKAFRAEPWVDQLVKQTIAMAEEFDKSEEWLKAMRLYADLSSIEPADPVWKEKLKLATRRIRLLALYTPGGIKELQKSESAERDKVDALLNPATQPTTKKSEDEDQTADAFKIDWRETVKGIKDSMLIDALKHAKANYYRPVEYKTLLVGGIKGLRAVATTKGLEQTFAGLGDEARRETFVALLDKRMKEAKEAADDPIVIDRMVIKLRGDIRTTQVFADSEEPVWLSEFADGAFAELDPFSSMIWPADLEEFNKTTQGEFSGVGIQIQTDEDGSLKVVSPLEDSPAYKAGIKAGDVIIKIDGKNAKGITLNQAVKTITGPSGTMVTLTVRSPDGSVKDYPIERRTIKVASIKGWLHRPGGGWDYFVDPDNKIAYLRLTNFTKSTTEELEKAARDLKDKGARAMILDLRYNPGGLLSAATEVTDKFLQDGLIVRTASDRVDSPNTPTYAAAEKTDDEIALPMVVLVNQYSASASEIVSGALKDHRIAKIVGERTFGKGSVQMLFPLANRSAYLKLTTSHYYLPLGKCIHREENSTEWGVDPDLTIEMTPEQMRAAIDARQDLDVLRDADVPDAPAQGKEQEIRQEAGEVKDAVAKASKDPMQSDPQLSAALLLLRMQLVGAQL